MLVLGRLLLYLVLMFGGVMLVLGLSCFFSGISGGVCSGGILYFACLVCSSFMCGCFVLFCVSVLLRVCVYLVIPYPLCRHHHHHHHD